MKVIRLLVVDDDDSVRAQLCSLFALEEGIELVGKGKNGMEAISMNRDLQPDVIIMDLKMPGMDGIEATKAIKDARPATKVVIFSAHDGEEYRARAKAAGASSYFLKGDPVYELIEEIKCMVIDRSF